MVLFYFHWLEMNQLINRLEKYLKNQDKIIIPLKENKNESILNHEVNIDPIDYLFHSPFIIFPKQLIPYLKIEDFIEYYRAYPKLNWSKYPKLFNLIQNHLNKNEKRNFNHFIHYHQKNDSFQSYIPFIKYFLIFKFILFIILKWK